MTIPSTNPVFSDVNLPVVRAMRNVVFDGRFNESSQVAGAVMGLSNRADSRLNSTQRATLGYQLLRQLLAATGPTRALLDDPARLFHTVRWAAILIPDVAPLLVSHLKATEAIHRLGHRTGGQERMLQALDSGDHVGAWVATELGSSAHHDVEPATEACWNRRTGGFEINTPTGSATKFMAPIAASVPKIGVVAARLRIRGKDEGTFPFAIPLRTAAGLTAGVGLVALPDTGFPSLADNALLRFDGVSAPPDAWLHGDLAWLDSDNKVISGLRTWQRFPHALDRLRISGFCSSIGALATAQAALWLATRAVGQRPAGGSLRPLLRDDVARTLASCAARVYAAAALCTAVQRQLANPDADPAEVSLLATVAKPLLAQTTVTVLRDCLELCGPQALIRRNLILSYIGNADVMTAETGDQQRLASGSQLKRRASQGAPVSAGVPRTSQWWLERLREREAALYEIEMELNGRYRHTTALGTSSQTADLAAAAADQLAVEALVASSEAAELPAREVLHRLAEVYALERIRANAIWYTATGRLAQEQAAQVEHDLALGYRRIAEQLPSIVEALGIPELNAPIAQDYVTAWLDYAGWTRTAWPRVIDW